MFSVAMEIEAWGFMVPSSSPVVWGEGEAELSSGASVGDRRGLQLALAPVHFTSVKTAFFTSRRQIGNSLWKPPS